MLESEKLGERYRKSLDLPSAFPGYPRPQEGRWESKSRVSLELEERRSTARLPQVPTSSPSQRQHRLSTKDQKAQEGREKEISFGVGGRARKGGRRVEVERT